MSTDPQPWPRQSSWNFRIGSEARVNPGNGWNRSRLNIFAERYRSERLTDPKKAEITRITDLIDFVLKTQGHTWADHAR